MSRLAGPMAGPRTRNPLIYWLFGVFAALVVGVGGRLALRRAGQTSGPERPNVILVTIDTLRADGLSCYGNRAAATPVLDALASRGLRFETVVAPVPLTAPSHASILTGLNPVGHGVRDNGGYVLPETIPVLAEVFRRAGYRTGAFISGFPLTRRFGFARGFDAFDDHLPFGNDPRRAPYIERLAGPTTDGVLRWLEGAAEPFLLWVHYYDPHAPYEPPPPYAERFVGRLYYGEVAYVDAQMGRLLEGITRRGLASRTITLVTSDHGESLGEHGEETHGIFVYDSTLRVPWVMAGPGVPSGRVIKTVGRIVDIAPTLIDYAGLPGFSVTSGRSLRPAAERWAMKDAPAYVESLAPLLHFGWSPLHAWRSSKWKLIDAPSPELYDLETDPTERRNLAAERTLLVEEMREALRQTLAAPTPIAERAIDSDTAERLAALGYLESRAPAPARDGPRKDPKDYVVLIGQLERGMSRARSDPAGAIADLTAVLRQDPGVRIARHYRAVSYLADKQPAAALADLQILERTDRLTVEDLIIRGDCLRQSGRIRESIDALDRAARLQPSSPLPWLSRASTLVKAGQDAEAAAAFEHVLGLVPDHIEALRGLGDLAMLQGDIEAAAGRYRRILQVDPEDTGATIKLGVIGVRQGRSEEAIRLFQKAVAREPRSAEALLYLAGALAATGRPAEAIPNFERALAAGPRTTIALNGLALARLEIGDRAGAAAALRESLALNPRQPEAARMLGEIPRAGTRP